MQPVMPANAARYGVRPLASTPISRNSGISVGQRILNDCFSLDVYKRQFR